ncbi:MAG: hypothetical protein ACO3XJ_01865 [Candidatus Nanopelagicales bacterium]
MRKFVLILIIGLSLSACAWTPNVNILGTLQPTPSDADSYLTILTPIENDVLVADSVIVAGRVNALDTRFEWRIETDGKVLETGTVSASASSPEVGVFILDLREFNLDKGRYTLIIQQRHKISNQVKLQDSVEFKIN